MGVLRLPPDEVEGTLHKELALALYQRGVLSSGKKSVLAGMGRSRNFWGSYRSCAAIQQRT